MLYRPSLASLENFIFDPFFQYEEIMLHDYCRVGEHTDFDLIHIKGGVGKGKTHLLYAIHNDLKANHPDYNIVIIDAKNLTDELIEGLMTNKKPDFFNKYQTVKALFIDNVEYLSNKHKTCNFLNHLFENITIAKGKVFLAIHDTMDSSMFTRGSIADSLFINLNNSTYEHKPKSFKLPTPEERQVIVERVNKMFKADIPRDPARIPLLLKEIERVWTEQPDLRLTQLILNNALPNVIAPDVYYLEDEVLMKSLKEA